MTVSKDQHVADANETADAAELSVSQLDQVSGGDPVIVQQVTANQQKGATKAAEAADALIRG